MDTAETATSSLFFLEVLQPHSSWDPGSWGIRCCCATLPASPDCSRKGAGHHVCQIPQPGAEGSRHPQDSHRLSLGRHWGSHLCIPLWPCSPLPALSALSCLSQPTLQISERAVSFLPFPAGPACPIRPASRLLLHFPPCSPFPAPLASPAPLEPGPQGSAGRVEAGACQSKQHTRRRRRAAEARAGKGQSPPADPAAAPGWGGSFPSLSKCSVLAPCSRSLAGSGSRRESLAEQSPGC